MVLIVSIVVIVVLALWIISLYNSLVKLRNNRENAFADIDVQLKQRHDLIPQLVATVKGYAAHEKDTLERVINARNGAMSAHTIDEKIKAENALSSALAGLKITLEAYRRNVWSPLGDHVRSGRSSGHFGRSSQN